VSGAREIPVPDFRHPNTNTRNINSTLISLLSGNQLPQLASPFIPTELT
jgi:hypothetical protein